MGLILDPNKEPKIILNPNTTPGLIYNPITSANYQPNFSADYQNNEILQYFSSWTDRSTYYPSYTTSTPFSVMNYTLTTNWSMEPETIIFKYKDKNFEILKESEELANKLITLELKNWITYLQYEDEGIVQLVKFLCGMKYKESQTTEYTMGLDIEKEMLDSLMKQISVEEDKNILNILKDKTNEQK